MSASGLFGKRVDVSLAGIKTIKLIWPLRELVSRLQLVVD